MELETPLEIGFLSCPSFSLWLHVFETFPPPFPKLSGTKRGNVVPATRQGLFGWPRTKLTFVGKGRVVFLQEDVFFSFENV